MKRGTSWLPAAFLLLTLAPTPGEASSVRLTYGFRQGSVYKVTEQFHDVGKTVTEMNVMGQAQKFETPTDQVSSGTWTARAVGKEGGGMRLAVTYGQHKGGERWSSNKVASDDIFAGSRADVVVHPVKGAVRYAVQPPDDATVDLIYRSRFAWMPELPEGFVRKGGSFTHEYVMSSGMFHIKSTDEYFLVEVKGDYVTFDVETKQLMVLKLSQAPVPEGMPQGMGGLNMGDMTLAYRGEGTAVFDVKEGIFLEREGKLSYSNLEGTQGSSPMPGQMAFSSRMEGVMKYRWEMEKE